MIQIFWSGVSKLNMLLWSMVYKDCLMVLSQFQISLWRDVSFEVVDGMTKTHEELQENQDFEIFDIRDKILMNCIYNLVFQSKSKFL